MKDTLKYGAWYIGEGLRPYVQYQFWHEDYDGATDSGDSRCGTADTIDEAKKQIDEFGE